MSSELNWNPSPEPREQARDDASVSPSEPVPTPPVVSGVRLKPFARLADWLRSPRFVDVPLLVLLTAVYLAGSVLFFRMLPPGSAADRVLVWGSVATHGLLFLSGAMFFGDGLFARNKWARAFSAGVFFLLVVSQIPDWILFNIQGFHLTYLLRVWWSGGWTDLTDWIAASRISAANLSWMFSIGWISVLVGGGAALGTRSISMRLPRKPALSVNAMALILVASFLLLVGEEWLSLRTKDQRYWFSSQQTFSLYIPAIKPRPSNMSWKVVLRDVRPDGGAEDAVKAAASAPRPAAGRHVFLFVLESVRAGFCTPEVAPNMTRFGEENLRFQHAWSNSNATMHGWYSVFHAHHPFYWHRYLSRPSFEGATTLRIIRNLGYQLAVFSSADFNYWGYDRTVFGDGFKLVDKREDFHALPQVEADRRTTDAAIAWLDHLPERAFVSIFLESAHHDYEWPKDRPPKFTPVADGFDYTRVRYPADELEAVKNRYRNAINYVDEQIGRFLDELKRRGLYESSTIILIGDHGEEFMEHGRITHASNLFEPQITPVFLMRLPGRGPALIDRSISQMQILPTVIHELGFHPPSEVFDGQPLFAEQKQPPFQLISNVRSADAPHRFLIHLGDRKLFFELDEDDPYHSPSLYPTRMTDGNDREIPFKSSGPELLREIDSLYGPYLRRVGFIERLEGPYQD